ncbi:hypothetical protein D9758_009122 [Tetrapyrgos nigripes]|uniref:Uncharacterized protein n=1 Tax=Tetrapyrgos nigripes TaxID=182062 RepID=A0A8H5G8R6_9AGAR|nr:hypothetical protein D9758_009122 [Tetrapyrgos nigripes]
MMGSVEFSLALLVGFDVSFRSATSGHNDDERSWDWSVHKEMARKSFKVLLVKMPLSNRPVWRCRKCGWNKAVEANEKSPGLPVPSAELNPLYKAAERWYGPPSVVDEPPSI